MQLPPDKLNRPAPRTLDLLLSRRSGSAKNMAPPGPDTEQLRTILSAGARVPDHGKLFPWRFIIFEGDGRARMGKVLAQCVTTTEPDITSDRMAQERNRFVRAPVVIGVVSRVKEGIAIPVWEQQLSAGACCQNVLLAAHAMGFVASWITEWCAYNDCVAKQLGLGPNERIAGFIYIGSPGAELEDRIRPELDSLITRF